MSERIEEIRERAKGAPEWGNPLAYKLTFDDIPYLLERIDELEWGRDRALRVIDELAKDFNAAEERVVELERENERLRQECINWQEMAHSLIPDE